MAGLGGNRRVAGCLVGATLPGCGTEDRQVDVTETSGAGAGGVGESGGAGALGPDIGQFAKAPSSNAA
ncbi:MAG: hypothetical protein HYZ29_28050 [Myxococcales bacterium]|nr:hypothetical protein [Myxococcales bacterium]